MTAAVKQIFHPTQDYIKNIKKKPMRKTTLLFLAFYADRSFQDRRLSSEGHIDCQVHFYHYQQRGDFPMINKAVKVLLSLQTRVQDSSKHSGHLIRSLSIHKFTCYSKVTAVLMPAFPKLTGPCSAASECFFTESSSSWFLTRVCPNTCCNWLRELENYLLTATESFFIKFSYNLMLAA